MPITFSNSGGLPASDGTLALPSIAFSSETSLGFYRYAAGIVGLSGSLIATGLTVSAGPIDVTGGTTSTKTLIGQGASTEVSSYFKPTAAAGRHYVIAAEMDPGATTAGDKVAIYGAARSGSVINGDIWAGNFLVQKDSGDPAMDVQILELDFNQNDADSSVYPTGGSASWGINLTSGGTFQPGQAIRIGASGAGNKWRQGILFAADSFSDIGISIGNPTDALVNSDLVLKQLANAGDTIIVQRSTDTTPTGYLLRAVNAANSANLASLDVAGVLAATQLDVRGSSDNNLATLFLQNSSIAANTTKTINIEFFGLDTVSTRKQVGIIRAFPNDANWVGAGLNFHVRASDAVAEAMRLTTVSNLKLAGTATRGTTEGTNHLDIFNGTAPVGTLTNGISIYSVSGDFGMKNAAGNLTRLGATVGFFNAAGGAQQVSAADLTNNVTAGGTDDTIADYASLTVYATDAAAIRNNIYQLSRKLKQVNDALRVYGLLS